MCRLNRLKRLGKMLRSLKLAVPAAMLALSACAVPFKAQVSRFQQLPAPQGQSFAVVADNPRLQGSLEFANYANIVADRLGRFGYVRTSSPTNASLIVSLDYGVDHGREKIRSYPSSGFGYGGYGGFGYGGFGRPFGGFGRRAFVYGFYDPFLFDDYNDVESYTVYNSELDMRVDRRGSRERVFEGTAKAMSTDDDLTTLVPNLIDAMFTGFPGNSGETVRITIAPPDKHASR
ncbi:MAG: DUF4136 domain-containing protein [Sphingomonadaceae bacterium]|nr:DUF4136 domain-containing protein [Sphingomonadaceae bacterium]